MQRRRLAAAGALALAMALCAAADAHAGAASARYCDRATPLTPRQQDRLLRVAELLRQELAASGGTVALVSRSGLDLRRFGLRHSHAGFALRDDPAGAWAVRQLYYACDERKPRLFDQGLAGFVTGIDDPASGFVSLRLLPPGPAAEALARAALDTPRALALVAGGYSAIAYPWRTRYLNCNQWVVEMLAEAWAPAPDATGTAPDAADARTRAQRWLREAGYEGQRVNAGSHGVMFAAGFMPLLRLDDHPSEDRFALQLSLSLPVSIDAFVRTRVPGTHEVQLCFDARQAVIRRDGAMLADDCRAEAGDRVVPLD